MAAGVDAMGQYARFISEIIYSPVSCIQLTPYPYPTTILRHVNSSPRYRQGKMVGFRDRGQGAGAGNLRVDRPSAGSILSGRSIPISGTSFH